MVISAALSAVTEKDLQRLVDDAVPEGRTIEYKGSLNLNNDDGKRKFLASITSFANAQGGDLVFGIEATAGIPRSLKSIPGLSADSEILRMEHLLNDGVSPRLFGIDYREVELEAGGSALVIRIPRSWSGPHMVTFNKDFRFYTRAANGRLLMDVPQLRSAFDAANILSDRVRDWRADRINRVLQADTPMPLPAGPKIILHIMPYTSFEGTRRYDLRALKGKQIELKPLIAYGWGCAEDFEAYFSYEGTGEGDVWSYVAVLRTGQLEVVDARTIDAESELIQIHGVEGYIRTALPRYFGVLETVGLRTPYVVALTLLGVRGYRFQLDGSFQGARPINRDMLMIPGILWDEKDSEPKTIARITRPIFDAIWNAVGLPRSDSYDDDGEIKDGVLEYQQRHLLG